MCLTMCHGRASSQGLAVAADPKNEVVINPSADVTDLRRSKHAKLAPSGDCRRDFELDRGPTDPSSIPQKSGPTVPRGSSFDSCFNGP